MFVQKGHCMRQMAHDSYETTPGMFVEKVQNSAKQYKGLRYLLETSVGELIAK